MTVSNPPVGLPRPNPTKSYWQTPPSSIADHRTTNNLPSRVKYAIIGSGITGASIAYKLLQAEPDASIVMIEARQTCSGATGRNGGHCRAGNYLYFTDYVKNFGEEEALRLEALEELNVQNVAAFIKEHAIDCDLRAVESVDTFTDLPQWEEALKALEDRQKVFSGREEAKVLTKHTVWSAKQVSEELLIPEALGAVSFPAYVLQPYKFVCGILKMCLAQGLNLQTNTAVLDVSKVPGSELWTVWTERGEISAEKVILATNAYTGALYPPLADFIIPTRAQLTAMRPGSAIAGNPLLEKTITLNSATTGDYFQVRMEPFSGAGDLIYGGGRLFGTNNEQPVLDDTTIHPNISKHQRTGAAEYFGRENWGEDGDVVMEWSGIMGYTKDRKAIIGEAPDQKGLFICAGFHGHGMALTFQSAEALVGILLGKEEEVNRWLPNCYKISRIHETAT